MINPAQTSPLVKAHKRPLSPFQGDRQQLPQVLRPPHTPGVRSVTLPIERGGAENSTSSGPKQVWADTLHGCNDAIGFVLPSTLGETAGTDFDSPTPWMGMVILCLAVGTKDFSTNCWGMGSLHLMGSRVVYMLEDSLDLALMFSNSFSCSAVGRYAEISRNWVSLCSLMVRSNSNS